MDITNDAETVFNYWAGRYADKYMDTSLYHESFDWFCEAINLKNPQILELGCGPGNITKYLLTSRPDFELLATDISEEMLTLARRNNPSVATQKLDCRNISALNRKFDGVIAGFCLPYLSPDETSKWISDLKNVLNEGGILYISTMEGDSENSGYQKSSTSEGPALYINYYKKRFLRRILKNNRFKILKTSRIEYVDSNGNSVVDLIMIAQNSNPV